MQRDGGPVTSGVTPQENPTTANNEPQGVWLTERIAGHAVMEKLLEDRRGLPPRSLLQRIFGADPLSADNYPWYKGALGEIKVGQILAALGPEWRVLHAVPVGTGTSDIDHVLIGPAGVFTLNTKNHSNQAVWVAKRTFMVAGKKQRHLYNAVHEADRAAKLLSRSIGITVNASAVVVVVAPKSMTVREKPTGVTVLTDRQLLRWLSNRPAVLSAWEVDQIAAAAAHPGTWHKNPQCIADPAALWREFAALRAAVDAARGRRAGWVMALLFGPLVLFMLSMVF